ncbi:MAG TPA: hypothetical protein PLG97_10025 [Alcaligenes sp.]|nr:hypothetical protein [Alcaligenes sp.]HRL27844.1 hypothetical protein [Alcaligenes sp.]
MTSLIAYLNHWSGTGPAALTGGPAPRAQSLPLYRLHEQDLHAFRALLIPAHADQRYLLSQRSRLQDYLLAGGTVVVNGHVAYPFLCWLTPFQAGTAGGVEGLRVHRARPHPIFQGVDPDELTFRRGVAGFYARGASPAPMDAVVLNTLGPDHLPIDWLLALPGGGRLLCHSGNDLWMYAGSTDSVGRIVPQLFDWLQGDAA